MQTQESRDFWSHALSLSALASPLAPFYATASVVGGWLLSALPPAPYATQFLALMGLSALDMLLGTLRGLAFERRGFSSTKFLRGLVKTAFILAIPLGLYWVSHIDSESKQLFLASCSGSIIWFGAWELMSIIRNAARCGVPVPAPLLRLLEGTLKAGEEPIKETVK